MIDPWKATHFGNGFAGEFLPAGERNWRYVKSGGQVIEFRSRKDAKEAAKQAYLARYESPIRSTNERSPEEEEARLEAKLRAEAENWLRSDRKDVKSAETRYTPGKRPFRVQTGRAPA
jgi:hypothetical protein